MKIHTDTGAVTAHVRSMLTKLRAHLKEAPAMADDTDALMLRLMWGRALAELVEKAPPGYTVAAGYTNAEGTAIAHLFGTTDGLITMLTETIRQLEAAADD